MKLARPNSGLLACSLFLFFAVTGLAQAASGPGESGAAATATAGPASESVLDLGDPKLFPPEFFPNLSEIAREELLLAGLRNFYPQRILTEVPEAELPEAAPPVVRSMEPAGVYIRVLHLPDALPVIRENLSHPLLVLDLRFLAADLDSTLALGSLLSRRQTFELSRAGDYPVTPEFLAGDAIVVQGENLRLANQTIFTLSNHKTRGPLEALLAQLRDDGEIISVGTPSPGETASFQPFPGFDTFYIISGEIRPAGGDSLAESGFVPRVQVNVEPTEDEVAYRSLREGVSLDDLIRRHADRPRTREQAPDDAEFPALPLQDELDEDEPSLPVDLILQRALNIVNALQALGKIAG